MKVAFISTRFDYNPLRTTYFSTIFNSKHKICCVNLPWMTKQVFNISIEDTSAKLLGMIISHDLKWNFHTSELSRKCSSRLYFSRQLKGSGVAPSELLLFYVTCIRPVLGYASPVFHRSLPNYISEDLERIQRRALRIIHPDLSYRVALETAGLPKLN